MTNRQRLQKVLNFEKPDRLPMYEWASWWDLTLKRFEEEGMPKGLAFDDVAPALGLDPLKQFWFAHRGIGCPQPASHGAGIMEDEKDYDALLPHLYPKDVIASIAPQMEQAARRQQSGEIPIWITLEGFFWFPRTLFGIENHLYAFYDYPALYHRICEDLVQFHLQVIEEACQYFEPEFMTFAEDMSYNNGPMLSKECFNEFLKPYYQQVIPALKKHHIKVFIDTDGFLEDMIPWLREAGIEGVLPLERQAGVDIPRIRKNYPDLLMLGGFDKMTMFAEGDAMEKEFERLFPVMQSGGYVLGVDHQTPPQVSFAQYKRYLALFRHYAQEAVK